MNLTFNDLTCTLCPKWSFSQVRLICDLEVKRKLLANVSGDFRPGELTGIMATSVSSVLMDILAGFTTYDVTVGDVQVDNRQRDLLKFRRSSAYVTQDNYLQPNLTVDETMLVAANLKLKMSNLNKRQVINTILKQLNLTFLRNTYAKDLSSMQMRQLIIALELISNPPIMFFEKPTSGLDNTSSYQIISQLKSLAREGRTIVCTLERPLSTKIFETIDHLYVIGYGSCVYAGSPRNLVPYLEDNDLRCPIYHNPADYLLESIDDDHIHAQLVASSDNGKSEKWRFTRVNLYDRSLHHEFQRVDIATSLSAYDRVVGYCYFIDELIRIRTLIEYNLIKLSRDRVLTYLRLSVYFLMGLAIGGLYYGIGRNNISANLKMLFLTQTILIFSSFYTSLVTFPLELPITRREYSNRWYNICCYYLTNRLADLPVQIIATSVYALIIYFMTGQSLEFQRIRLFLISCALVSLVSQTLGVIVATIFNGKIATIVGPLTLVSSILLSGFLVRVHHVYSLLRWIFHLSFSKYGFEELVATVYGLNVNHNDFSRELRVLRNVSIEFGLEQLNYWLSAWILIGFYVVFNFIACLALKARVRRRDR